MNKHDWVLLGKIAFEFSWKMIIVMFAIIGIIEFYFTVIY